MEECSHEYDDKLDLIDHYKLYPEMKVWVGCNYSKNSTKLLLIGESHYLNKESEYHLDPKIWYAGVEVSEKIDCKNIKTRNIIYNGIKTKWQLKSKTIFRNIEKALFESLFFEKKPLTAFTEVAFMNRTYAKSGNIPHCKTPSSCTAIRTDGLRSSCRM